MPPTESLPPMLVWARSAEAARRWIGAAPEVPIVEITRIFDDSIPGVRAARLRRPCTPTHVPDFKLFRIGDLPGETIQ